MKVQIIAPCGMNCGICLANLREKNVCYGCWSEDENKRNYCTKCAIKNCGLLLKTDSKFCYDCSKFPCTRLKQLDKRYRLKYHMSMIENLTYIKDFGLENFEQKESVRWKCENCGGIICVHSRICSTCKLQMPG